MRPCEPHDHAACVALLDGNTPEFFASEERAAYASFLAEGARFYFVLERHDAVIACGGVALFPDPTAGVTLTPGTAGLTWGMVRRDLHGQGVGTDLLRQRLAWLRTNVPDVHEVRLATSQITSGYYARQGFEIACVTRDGFAPGLDAVQMYMPLR